MLSSCNKRFTAATVAFSKCSQCVNSSTSSDVHDNMRLQSFHRQALVIIAIVSFLWISQKVLEAVDFGEEPLDDKNIKAKIEKRNDHEDEIFVKGPGLDVQADEDESIDYPEVPRIDSNEDNIDQQEKEKLVKNRVEVIAHDIDEFRVDIENKIDGPTSNISKDGLENVSLDKKSKLNSKTLVVEPDVDQNQEAGRKRVEARAKSKIVGPAKKRGAKHRADKKLQVMKSDGSHDMEAGRKKIAEQNHSND